MNEQLKKKVKSITTQTALGEATAVRNRRMLVWY